MKQALKHNYFSLETMHASEEFNCPYHSFLWMHWQRHWLCSFCILLWYFLPFQ